jgi:uncharacterized protein (TIGR03905 family)
MKYTYKPTGVCSKEISFDLNSGVVTNINFVGGCPGNLKMISKILDGWKIEDIIKMCRGNLCGIKNTSCSDQLAKALEEAYKKEKVYLKDI